MNISSRCLRCTIVIGLWFGWRELARADETHIPSEQKSTVDQVTIHPDQPQQQVWGMGFELQCDSIASGNHGMTDSMVSVPHDLAPSERNRLADEMLKGFRFCRLAGGLYWRGLDADQKQLEPRWPEQLAEVKSLLDRAGVESLSFEYWSPPPYWKENRTLVGSKEGWRNTLRCFRKDFADDPEYHGDTDRFLGDFANAVCADIRTLQSAGLKVGFFGLQNEPFANAPYSSCVYSAAMYGKAFVPVARAIRKMDPSIKIIADTGDGKPAWIAPVLANPANRSLVDCLVVHTVGWDSATVPGTVKTARKMITDPLPLYQNEFEYLSGGASAGRCLNTVQSIMNWYQLAASPTWYWIHCLKPLGNSEASGYALGFWRPTETMASATSESSTAPAEGSAAPAESEAFRDLQPGHFAWNDYNWFSVVGFLKHMPWDSTVVKLDESHYSDGARILAFKRPDGKLVIVVSNRSKQSFTFDINDGLPDSTAFAGYAYTPHDAGAGFLGEPLAARQGGSLELQVPSMSWEFWIQQ